MISATLDKLLVIVRCDTLSAVRYRAAMPLAVLSGVIELAGLYYLARAVGPDFRPDGMDYFSFLLVGTGFFGFFVAGISAFVRTLEEAQKIGTLEVLMTTSTPPAVLLLLNITSAFLPRAINMLLYVGAGIVLFGYSLHAPNMVGFAIVFLLSLLLSFAVALFAASIQIAFQRGSGTFLVLLGSGTWLLTGTMFPVDALPAFLRHLSFLVPITYSLQGMRMALFKGASLSQLMAPIAFLTLTSAVLLPTSIWLFSLVLRRARLHGSLSMY